MAFDVLKNKHEYYFYYEKEDTQRDTREYAELTKYMFFESGKDWVK